MCAHTHACTRVQLPTKARGIRVPYSWSYRVAGSCKMTDRWMPGAELGFFGRELHDLNH